jgi:hypothetical protein
MAGARQQQNDAQPLSALVSHNPFGFRPPDDDMVAAIQFLSLTKRSDDRVVHLETAEFFTFRAGLILTLAPSLTRSISCSSCSAAT